MRISHRLIIQSIAAAIALLGVGALGLLGVRHVQQELYVMTGDILPLKNQLLSIELSKEQTLNSLLALSHSSNQKEANRINALVSSELEDLQLKVDLINKQEQIDEIDISAFIQTRNDILKNIVVNFDGIESYQNASKKALQTLRSVSSSVKEVNKGVQAIEQKSTEIAQSARDNVNELLSEQQKANRIARALGKANVLLYATDAVQSKYKIGPTIERFSAVSDEIKALKVVALGHDRIESSIGDLEKIGTLFSEEKVGLFARKKALLEEEPKAKSAYRKILKNLSTTIDQAERTNTQAIDDLEFEIVLANKKMSTALNFSSDPSSITSVNQTLTINTRDMQIGMQGLLAATDRKTLEAEYSESIARMNSLSANAQLLTTELQQLEMAELSATADTIAQLIGEVKKSVDLVHEGKLALFDGSQALKRSIDSLKQVSSSQREHGQALVAKIDNMLSSVIESVDGKVNQSTSLIVVISFAAVLFSAAFSYITIRAIVSRLQRALHVAEAVSTGDLRAVEQSEHKDEITSVLDALSRMVSMLDRSVRQIRTASAEVNQGAEEISSGNSALNDRNGQQAQHLNDTASTTRKINELVQTGAGAIQQVSELSYTASTAANRGREVVLDAMHSMNNIESGAKEISNIISVIDSIAFQTNILALNAAVEASRAGEVGRGFAVVASEVRELASKSKESANQIKAIIDSNVAEVEAGSVLVNNAGEHINDVVCKVDEVKALIDNIAISSKHQVESIAHIDSSVDEIENMTQKNASLSEHTSDAASNLLQQARSLDQAVSVFKL